MAAAMSGPGAGNGAVSRNPEGVREVSSARAAALQTLAEVDCGAGFLREALDAVFQESALPLRDRALATQLATGVIRHRRTLRLILSHLRGAHGRAAAIQPKLRTILELGAFQLLFLDRVPAYAAVSEAAAAARLAARGPQAAKAAGFVNAMLRNLGRLIIGRDHTGRAARNALPHPDGGVVRLQENVLPDPRESVAAFLGTAYSYPDWLAARWVDAFGDKAEEICRWGNRRPHVFARVNPMRHDVEVAGAAGPRPGSIDVASVPPERLEAFLAEGVLTVQDPSAMAAVETLAPAPGENVLDLCASPGTKTTQIVEAMGDSGCVVASDRSEEKLAPIRKTATARGLKSVTICLASDVATKMPPGGFDAALADVPCSNTGVLARRPEARWRLRPEDISEELPPVQRAILKQAAGLVRPGGRLVYSTCSIEHEENDGLVHTFLKTAKDWRIDRQELILPGADHDGAFWALLRRT